LNFIKKQRAYLLVFALALTLRLGFFFMVQPFGPGGEEKLLVNDASGYHNIAVSLLQQGTYPPHDDYQSMLRTIGYPFFIEAVYFVFGVHPWVVVLLQLILDSLLALLLIRFARLFGLQKAAFLAGILWAIDPLAIFSCNAFLSDSLFVLLLTASFFYLARFLLAERSRDLYIAAVLLALAAHVRPVGLYLLFILAVALAFHFYKQGRIREWAVFSLIFLMLIAPWVIRNKIQHRHFFFSISGDYNALILYAAPLYAREQGLPREKVKNVLEEKMSLKYALLKNKDPYAFYQQYRSTAIKIIMNAPFAFLKQSIKGAAKMFFGLGRETILNALHIKEPKIRLFNNLFEIGLIQTIAHQFKSFSFTTIAYLLFAGSLVMTEYVLAVKGLTVFFKVPAPNLIFPLCLLLPILFFSAVGMPIGFLRFKLTVIPFYLILTGKALSRPGVIWKQDRKSVK